MAGHFWAKQTREKFLRELYRLRGDGVAVAGVCIFLVAIVWLAFGPTLRNGFVNYDDDAYVYQNPVVQAGLTRPGILWAFRFGGIGHWHPVTWISHMLDFRLFGLWAGGHHLTSVILHAIAAILLFLALKQMTGTIWRSACVAALFAIHPQRVESVAWIAERKDVLSGVFFMATILAYVGYVRSARSRGAYAAVLILFALGLMSKGMLVTLPFVLLLLDYWPLRRLATDTLGSIGQPENRTRVGQLIAEKIPLFLLSAASCIMTNLSPEKLPPALQLPFPERFANASVSYFLYIKQMTYPAGLTIPYFNSAGGIRPWQVVGAVIFLIAISAGVLKFWRTRPYLLVGWFWYLGMMVPVLGLVGISYYSRADRYTYLPQIGLYLMAIWGGAELLGRSRMGRSTATVAGVLLLTLLIPRTRAQVSYWRDSERLWNHALAEDPNNYVAHGNLGMILGANGQIATAIRHFEKAIEIQPSYVEAYYNLGTALSGAGKRREAIAQYEKALLLRPDMPQVENNLGSALAQEGRLTEAIPHFRKAIELNPNYDDARNNLAAALALLGQPGEVPPPNF